MKISTKGRYGLRALVDLAYHSNQKVSLVSIAQRQNISLNYLEQVFSTMRRAGILKSIKGAQGGYIMTVKPEDISVNDVLEILEGKFSIVDEDNSKDEMDPMQQVIYELVWDRINKDVISYASSVKLSDLVTVYEKRIRNLGEMYYI